MLTLLQSRLPRHGTRPIGQDQHPAQPARPLLTCLTTTCWTHRSNKSQYHRATRLNLSTGSISRSSGQPASLRKRLARWFAICGFPRPCLPVHVPGPKYHLHLILPKHLRPLLPCSSIHRRRLSSLCKSCSRPPKSASPSSSFRSIIFGVSRSATALLPVSPEVSFG